MIPVGHYPTNLIDRWSVGDGQSITLRPILPQDGELEQTLVRELSAQSRYDRFFVPIRELSQRALEEITHIDYQHRVVLIAETFVDGIGRAVGEAQYVVTDDGDSCEFALVVADAWRRRGIATHLLLGLIESARESGLRSMVGDVLATNEAMLSMMRKRGFRLRRHPEDARLVQVRLELVLPLTRWSPADGLFSSSASAAPSRRGAATALAP